MKFKLHIIAGIIIFWIVGDLATTYVVLGLGGVETSQIPAYLINNYNVYYNIVYKLLITIGYLTIVYIMDTYIESKKYKISDRKYYFYSKIPVSLLYLIVLNGLYLTIHNSLMIAIAL